MVALSGGVDGRHKDVEVDLETGIVSAAVNETEAVTERKIKTEASTSREHSGRLDGSDMDTEVEDDLEMGRSSTGVDEIEAVTESKTKTEASTSSQHSAKMKILSDADFDAIREKLDYSWTNWRSVVAEIDTVCIQREGDGETLLHCFAGRNRDLTAYLLAAGVPADAKTTDGRYPLMDAARGGDLDVCKLLCDYGADIDFRNDRDYYKSPMMSALLHEHYDVVEWMMHHPKYSPEWDHRSFRRLRERKPELVVPYLNLFAVEQAPPTSQHLHKQRERKVAQLSKALLNAAQDGDVADCKLLCEYGADISFHPDNDGWSMLLEAVMRGHYDVADWLIHHPKYSPDWDNSIFSMLRDGKPELVIPYLDRFTVVPPNSHHLETQNKRKVAKLSDDLMSAASRGNLGECKLLCEYGADINFRPENNGWPMLEKALFREHHDLLDWVVHHPEYRPDWDHSTFETLRQQKPELVVAYLNLFAMELSRPTSEHLQRQNERKVADLSSDLLDAAWNGKLGECQLLCDYGADINLVGANGSNPMQVALAQGHYEVVEWLVYHPKYRPKWDNSNFKTLCKQKPELVVPYLNLFALELPPQTFEYLKEVNKVPVTDFSSRSGVKYRHLKEIYGRPEWGVADTALAQVIKSPVATEALDCKVMRHIIKAKWLGFGKTMFRQEVFLYIALVVAFSISIVCDHATEAWNEFHTTRHRVVGITRIIAAVFSAVLLTHVERREAIVEGPAYLLSFWNLLGAGTYVGIIVIVIYQAYGAQSELLQLATGVLNITLWINMYQYLQMTEHFAVLVAMMSHMVGDVVKFLLLYSMFLFGFSGGFYAVLFSGPGFETYVDALKTVVLMLFGQVNLDPFKAVKGLTWIVANLLLLAYLVSVVIVLLNVLISMMSTSFGKVWGEAEGQVLLSYAQNIIRMEQSISESNRRKQVDRLTKDVDDLKSAAWEKHRNTRPMGTLHDLRKEVANLCGLPSFSPVRWLFGAILYLVGCFMVLARWLLRGPTQSHQKSLVLVANAITDCSTLDDGERWEVGRKKSSDDQQTDFSSRVDKLTSLVETLVKVPRTDSDQQTALHSRVEKLTSLVETLVGEPKADNNQHAAVDKLTSLVESLVKAPTTDSDQHVAVQSRLDILASLVEQQNMLINEQRDTIRLLPGRIRADKVKAKNLAQLAQHFSEKIK